MSKRKARANIPEDIAAQVLFLSNRVCCVCRDPAKSPQIHHIDENPSNNSIDNLAVLCFECHHKTHIKGGFARKLDAAQVRLYRTEWLHLVEHKRAENTPNVAFTEKQIEENAARATSSRSGDITIHSAQWGAKGRWDNLSDILMSKIRKGQLIIDVTRDEFGDPIPYEVKTLNVSYSYAGRDYFKTVIEDQKLILPNN